MSAQSQNCPIAIVQHVRNRLEQMIEGAKHDSRPWYLKWFVVRDYGVPHAAEVVQVSRCSIETLMCDGAILNTWAVSKTEVFCLVGSEGSRGVGFVDLEPIPVFLFGISDDAKSCVLIEIDIEGKRNRSAFALPEGVKSKLFSELIGRADSDRVSRKNEWHPVQRMSASIRVRS